MSEQPHSSVRQLPLAHRRTRTTSADVSNANSASPQRHSVPAPQGRQRQQQQPKTKHSVGNSPLHVAAMFASAAKAAIGSADSALLREDERMARLFMNADDVFRAWEGNMRLGEEDSLQPDRPGTGVRKNASMSEKGAERTTRLQRMLMLQQQRAQSTEQIADEDDPMEQRQSGLTCPGPMKLSTGSMPVFFPPPITARTDDRLMDLARNKRSSSIQQHKASAPQLAELPKRRSSGLGPVDSTSTELRKVALDNDYHLLREIGAGQFGCVRLAEHKQSKQRISLKFFARPQTKQTDFAREYQIARFLSPHPNILDTFEGAFETDDESAFFFVQEFGTHQSLRDLLNSHPGGLGEVGTKAVLGRVLAAVEFMHAEGLVHRCLRAEHVLVFDPGRFTRVKITEFGWTRPVDSMVRHAETASSSYHAPELCEKVPNETFGVSKAVDVWALGVLTAYCAKGKFPWQKAYIMCKPYWEWDQWLKRKAIQLPKYWDAFSEKALRLFKHALNPKPKDRWEVREMRKLLEKERLLKKAAPDDEVYYPEEDEGSLKHSTTAEGKAAPKKSVIGQWINSTLNTMSNISEQVVSARDDD